MAIRSDNKDVRQPTDDAALAQYKMYSQLYKFYIEWIIKLNTFYYTVMGTLLGYVLVHSSQPEVRFALLLPAAFSIGLVIVFFISKPKIRELNTQSLNLSNLLHLQGSADFLLLLSISTVFMLAHIITAVVLICLVIFPFVATS